MSLANDQFMPDKGDREGKKAQTILRNYECSSDDMM